MGESCCRKGGRRAKEAKSFRPNNSVNHCQKERSSKSLLMSPFGMLHTELRRSHIRMMESAKREAFPTHLFNDANNKNENMNEGDNQNLDLVLGHGVDCYCMLICECVGRQIWKENDSDPGLVVGGKVRNIRQNGSGVSCAIPRSSFISPKPFHCKSPMPCDSPIVWQRVLPRNCSHFAAVR